MRGPWFTVGVFAVLGVGLGFVVGRSFRGPPSTGSSADETATADWSAQVDALTRHAEAADRTIAEQRALLRPQALKGPARSIDEMLALFPMKFPEGNWRPAEGVFEDCWFETVDGLRLHGWLLEHPDPRAVVLHVHGNAGNVTHRASLAAILRERIGASVLLFDYRGYGRSEGVPTIEGLIRDARAARDFCAERAKVSPRDVVLMGESLGGGVAVQLAAEDGARTLILQNTFLSLRDVAKAHYPAALVNIVVADRLDSGSNIGKYRGPLVQCHGDADRVIPFAQAESLFAAANDPKTFVRVEGGDHNDPPSEAFLQAILALIETRDPSGSKTIEDDRP